MVIQIVKFKPGMSPEKVLAMSKERAPRFRALESLKQKYYLKWATGEFGAVYVWESEAAMKEFRESELGRTIASAYEVRGAPDVQAAELVMTLR